MIIRIDMALNIFCQCGIWLINKILLQESSERAPLVNLRVKIRGGIHALLQVARQTTSKLCSENYLAQYFLSVR